MNEKRKRLESFILPLLTCVVCRNSRLKIEGDRIRCRICKKSYPIHNDIPIMMTRPQAAFEYSPAVVVENSYPQQWLDIIKNAGNEPVLDMGSGNNPDQLSNLVKLEIFALPYVDVVGYGENLPFSNGCFHTVFSGAVIEHVSDPFEVVRNIKKVLRDNGEIYIETAFLQPVHAYPSHYFNMTKQGLERLCSEFTRIDSGVKPHQYPSFTLQWILNSWQNKLEGEEKKAFLGATVQEIIDEYTTNVFSNKWLSGFADIDREELASGVYFHGRKDNSEKFSFAKELKRRVKNSIKCIIGRH